MKRSACSPLVMTIVAGEGRGSVDPSSARFLFFHRWPPSSLHGSPRGAPLHFKEVCHRRLIRQWCHCSGCHSDRGVAGPEGPPTPRRNLAVRVVSNDECPTVWCGPGRDPSLRCVLRFFERSCPSLGMTSKEAGQGGIRKVLSFRAKGLQAPTRNLALGCIER